MKNQKTPAPSLYIALELSDKSWKVGFCTDQACRARLVHLKAGSFERLMREIALAQKHFDLPEHAVKHSVYEAGRDGFWIHRLLIAEGINNLVIDPGSIEKARRKSAKTDRLDVDLLLNRLIRWLDGDTKVWSVLRVPSEEVEAERVYTREWRRLKKERSSLMNRIRSLLILYGIRIDGPIHSSLKNRLHELRGPRGITLPETLIVSLEGELDRLALLERQIKAAAKARKERLEKPANPIEETAAKLATLYAVGPIGAECLAQEFLYRDFRNRREVGGASGLTGTPFSSGDINRDTGISKIGNKQVRCTMIELSWLWLRYQPDSELARWFQQRFGSGTKRQRRIGIVALARKLIIAFWRYVKDDTLPEGARLKGVFPGTA